MINNKDFQNYVHVGLDDPFGLMNLINEYLNNLKNYFPISSRIMFTAASMTYQRQRKREKEAAKRALAKMEVILFGGRKLYHQKWGNTYKYESFSDVGEIRVW